MDEREHAQTDEECGDESHHSRLAVASPLALAVPLAFQGPRLGRLLLGDHLVDLLHIGHPNLLTSPSMRPALARRARERWKAGCRGSRRPDPSGTRRSP